LGTIGSGIDTHMMKNTEWGAVAYLFKSLYGKSAEIWINPMKILLQDFWKCRFCILFRRLP
jgi:hypothetical protein